MLALVPHMNGEDRTHAIPEKIKTKAAHNYRAISIEIETDDISTLILMIPTTFMTTHPYSIAVSPLTQIQKWYTQLQPR